MVLKSSAGPVVGTVLVVQEVACLVAAWLIKRSGQPVPDALWMYAYTLGAIFAILGVVIAFTIFERIIDPDAGEIVWRSGQGPFIKTKRYEIDRVTAIRVARASTGRAGDMYPVDCVAGEEFLVSLGCRWTADDALDFARQVSALIKKPVSDETATRLAAFDYSNQTRSKSGN